MLGGEGRDREEGEKGGRRLSDIGRKWQGEGGGRKRREEVV